MIDDRDLGYFTVRTWDSIDHGTCTCITCSPPQNVLGIVIMVLVVFYHYIAVDARPSQ